MQEDVKIIYEDESILAIDKPAGLIVHPDNRTSAPSLVDWLKMNYPELENIGRPHTLDSGKYTSRWGMLNRLDKETSGIVLIAKDEECFQDLYNQFLNHDVKKEYIAEVVGTFLPGEKGKITEPISRHKKDPRIWVCGTGMGERKTKRSAETDYEVVEVKGSTTVVKLFPKTGRTHQLRLHMRFIGHPILGDVKYGLHGIINEHSASQVEKYFGDTELMELDTNTPLQLRAVSVEFIHPLTKIKMKVSV